MITSLSSRATASSRRYSFCFYRGDGHHGWRRAFKDAARAPATWRELVKLLSPRQAVWIRLAICRTIFEKFGFCFYFFWIFFEMIEFYLRSSTSGLMQTTPWPPEVTRPRTTSSAQQHRPREGASLVCYVAHKLALLLPAAPVVAIPHGAVQVCRSTL